VGYRKGPIVECPKCKQVGRETVIKVKAKGHEYYYRAVIHLDGRKCLVERVSGPPVDVSERLRQYVEQLRRENQELRERLARVDRFAEVERILLNSRLLRERELAALRAVYVRKKGYTPEQLEVAKEVIHSIVDRGTENGLAVICFPPPHLASLLQRRGDQVPGAEREGPS